MADQVLPERHVELGAFEALDAVRRVTGIVAEKAGRGARSPVRPGLAGTELPDPNGLP